MVENVAKETPSQQKSGSGGSIEEKSVDPLAGDKGSLLGKVTARRESKKNTGWSESKEKKSEGGNRTNKRKDPT